MDDLTEFQRDVLHVLSGMDEPHGLAVAEELEQYYQADVDHGRVYPALDALVERDLVERTPIDRRRHRYALTHRGRRAMRNRREWVVAHADDPHSAPE